MGNFGYIFGYCLFGVFCLGVMVSYEIGRIIKMMDINEAVKEADQYVRDHLLIEFMIERKYHPFTDVEDMYRDWKEWFKEQQDASWEKYKKEREENH